MRVRLTSHTWQILLLANLLHGNAAAADSLSAIPPNTWQLVSHGDVTAPLDIMAYSGGWFDPEQQQFCIFGGGHFNYSGNEVWCFDTRAREWTEMYPPDVVTTAPYAGGNQGAYLNFDNERYPGALFDPAGEPISSARPISRHTYDQLEFIPGKGALLWGGIGWGDIDSPWCVRCADTWLYELSGNRWNYLYNGRNPSPNKSPGVGASAYSTHDNRLYAKVLQETWSFDPERATWEQVRTRGEPPWSIEGTLEYDPVHRTLYFFGGNYEKNYTLWQFDIDKRHWRKLNPTGEGPSDGASNGPGLAYDTANDLLLVYSGGTIWAYDPVDNAWLKRQPARRPADDNYVFGRFRYDPHSKGVWLHTAEAGKHATWFFRFAKQPAVPD